MPDFQDHGEVLLLLGDAQDVEHDNRELMKEAHLFVTKADGQWEPGRWSDTDGKPRYTFDQTSPIIDQVSGDIEKSDFDIQIKPSGGGSSKDLAELRDGLVRNIETISDAQSIYSDAGRNMVTSGFDGWMVVQAFLDDMSFDQDLMIEPIPNWGERVWFDPNSTKRDRSDSRYGFLLSNLTKDTYEERFPDGSGISVDDDRDSDVYHEKVENIIIGHIFFEKRVDTELVKTNLERVFEVNDDFKKIEDELQASGNEVITDRRKIKKTIFWVRKFDGKDWLDDETETVFSTVPLVPLYGNFKIIEENKTVYHGVVQKVMDPQRVLNYSLSREIEEGALAPRAKYWMTLKQMKGHQLTLATLNTNFDPVQTYTHDPEAPGPPQQQGGAAINPGLRNISANMTQLMGSTAGIFSAGMGDTPDFTQSGIAIDKLQDKSNNITVKYMKAMEVAICYTARLLNDALPKVYDTRRQLRIIKDDGSFDLVAVNEMVVVDEESGQEVMTNDLSAGKYDITCKAGPSFDSRQSEAVTNILEIAKVDPTIMQTGGDILLKMIAAPGMEKIAERKRQQLFEAGVIPESQFTEEEQAQAKRAQQNQKPDAAMALAQAEQSKADAENAKVQVSLFKLQSETQIKAQEISLKAQALSIQERESILKIQEKSAKLGLDADNQRFEQDLAAAQENRQRANDAVDNLNTQADTLKKIREGMGVDTFTGPNVAQSFIGQAQDLNETINDSERIEDGSR